MLGDLQVNGSAVRPYKVFTEQATINGGVQSLAAFNYEYGGANNIDGSVEGLIPSEGAEIIAWETYGVTVDNNWYQQIEEATGSWYSPETGLTYVNPAESAAMLWNPAIKKIIMFDTLGIDDWFGTGLQNNKIEVFVLLKDIQAGDTPLYCESPNTTALTTGTGSQIYQCINPDGEVVDELSLIHI